MTNGTQPQILIVEDNGALRRLMLRILSGSGYAVLEAPTGARGLELFREHSPSIDLAIVNLVLPDESTSRFVRTLTVMHPGLRVLYMTHHLASSRSELRRMPRSGFAIEKPFKPNEFLLAVRQALDSMPASSQESYPLA